MKRILSALFALAALAFVPTAAQAQYAWIPLDGMPATLATTVSTNLASPPVIDCTKQANVAILLSFNQSSASTSNVIYTFQSSINRSNWDTVQTRVITVASTGTTRRDCVTNITVNGVGYLRLVTIDNGTALTTMTNFGVQYAVKVQQ